MNKLYFLDFISPKVQLYYKGKTSHTSLASIIISILTFLILLVLSIIFSLDFFLNRNPTAFYYNRYISDVGIYPLNSSKLFHFISFGNYSVYTKKAFSIIGVYNVIENEFYKNNNESNYDHWIYGKCEKKDAGDKYKYLDNFTEYFENGFCIKGLYNSTLKKVFYDNESEFYHPTQEHGASNVNEQYYGIYIQRCQNNSEINNFECYSENVIDEIVYSSDIVSIFFVDQYIDIENYKNPFVYFYHQISNKINKVSYTINALNFHTSLVRTSTGILFENKKCLETYVYDLNEKLVKEKTLEDYNENIFGSFFFSIQNMQNVYVRKYKMLQDIAASIGGIVKLITIFSYVINFFFFKNTVFNDLVRDLKIKYKRIENTFEKSSLNLLLYNNNNINESKKTILKNNFIENNNSNFVNGIDKSMYLNSNNLKSELNVKNFSTNINYNTCRKVINQNNKNLYYNNTHLNRKNQKKMNYYINLICCFKNDNNPVQLIIKFKKKIISEEEIFVSHFLLKSLQSVCFEKKYEYRTKKYCTNDFNNIKYKNTMNNINIKKKSIIYNSQNENSKEFNNKNEKKF
jgi:hypothetical protein